MFFSKDFFILFLFFKSFLILFFKAFFINYKIKSVRDFYPRTWLEFFGFFVKFLGPNVQLELGTRVVVAFGIACGFCDRCKAEEYTGCETTNPSRVAEKMFGHALTGVFGYGHLVGGYWGGQAEYVRVPFADINCLPIPDDVPDEKALYLSDVIMWAHFHSISMTCG